MKVGKIQVDDNRRILLAAAARLFRQRGFEAVSISEVMAAAGLAPGVFQGYFRSKEELVAAALVDLLATRRPTGKWAQSAARYLSPGPREDSGGAAAALADDAGRGSPQARDGAEEAQRLAAIGRVAAMVGALILSRAVGEGELSDELFAATRAWIGQDAEAPSVKLVLHSQTLEQ